MTETRVVLVTVPDEAAGRSLSRQLLEENLVACGNIVPGLTSVYRWEGRVHEDPEVLLILKTDARSVGALVKRVPELHPYDVPEVLVLEVDAGHEPYLEWVSREAGASRAP